MKLINLLFSFSGREARKQYWLGITISSLLLIVPMFTIAFSMLGGIQTEMMQSGNINLPTTEQALASFYASNKLLSFLFIPLLIASGWSLLAVTAKRFHDMNWSGWFCLYWLPVYILPEIMPSSETIMNLASFILPIIFGYLKGTDGSNRYGDQDSGDRG